VTRWNLARGAHNDRILPLSLRALLPRCRAMTNRGTRSTALAPQGHYRRRSGSGAAAAAAAAVAVLVYVSTGWTGLA